MALTLLLARGGITSKGWAALILIVITSIIYIENHRSTANHEKRIMEIQQNLLVEEKYQSKARNDETAVDETKTTKKISINDIHMQPYAPQLNNTHAKRNIANVKAKVPTEPDPRWKSGGMIGSMLGSINRSPYFLFPSKRYQNPRLSSFNTPMIDDDRKLLFCWIPKNACTQFKALFCRGTSEIATLENDTQLLSRHNFVHFKCFKHNVTKYDAEHKYVFVDDDFDRWAVLRDPIDRFISGFVDKCMVRYRKNQTVHCYGCLSDVDCFIRENYIRLQQLSRGNIQRSVTKWQNVDHFFPQYWFCGFTKYLNKYTTLFNYSPDETFRQNVRTAFLAKGWPHGLISSGWGLDGKYPFLSPNAVKHSKTRKSITSKKKIKVLESMQYQPELIQLLLKTYWIDYELLKLPIPQYLLEHCRKYAQTCEDYLQFKHNNSDSTEENENYQEKVRM